MAIGVLDRSSDLGAQSLLAGETAPVDASGAPILPSGPEPAPVDAFDEPAPELAARRREGAVRHSLPRPAIGDCVALVALLVLLVEVCAGVLPDDPTLLLYFTPLRQVLGLGLVAAVLASASHGSWGTALDLPAAVLALAAIPAARAAGDFSPWRWLVTYVAAYYLTVFVVRRVHDLRESLGLLGLGGVAIAAFAALTQAATQEPTGMCRSLFTGSADCEDPDTLVRVIGTFANPNTLGAFLVLAMPFAIAAALAAVRTTSRIISWGIVAAGGIALLFTFSRGPLVAVLFGVLAYLVLRRPEPRRLRGAGIVTAAGLGLFLLVTIVAPDAVGVRWDVWRAAIAQALRNPLGVGLQAGGGAIQDYIGDEGAEDYLHAHNLWLNMWLETGWLGLAASVAITVLAALMVIRLARRGSTTAPIVGAALAGFAIASVVDHSANTVRIAIALAVVLGVLAGEYGAPRSLRGTVRRPLEAVPPVPVRPADTLLDD